MTRFGRRSARRPRKIVVSAGKGGVGTTTVAVNLAVALGRMAAERFCVDADLSGADATWLCGVEVCETIADVLSGRRTVHEVLRPGPGRNPSRAGRLVAGRNARLLALGQQRLLRQLDQLGRHAEWT